MSASTARAGGILFPDLGTVALGRGGAFMARADNLSAFYYNPAGLSKSKGFNVLIGTNLVDLNVDYWRRGAQDEDNQWIPTTQRQQELGITVGNPMYDWYNETPQQFGLVSQRTLLGLSAVSVVGNWGDAFNVDGLSIAVGLRAPSAFGGSTYWKEGPQRYAMRDMSTMIIYPGVGLSYAINRYIQIGAVFNNGMAFVKKEQANRLSNQPGDPNFNEDSGGDGNFGVDVKDLFVPTGVVGVLSNPVDFLELGLSFRMPVKVAAKGKVDYTPPQLDYPNAHAVEGHDKVTVKYHIPWVVSAGLRYIHDRFDIEVDYVWENWATLKGLDVLLDVQVDLNADGNNVKTIPDVHIPKNYRDSHSIRLGSDIAVWPHNITARVGGFYQTSAYPEGNNTFSVDFPFGEQFGVGCGATWHAFEIIDVNVSYLHIFQPRVTVTEGILQQGVGSPIDMSEAQDLSDLIQNGNTVNNGSYDVNLNIISVSAEGHF